MMVVAAALLFWNGKVVCNLSGQKAARWPLFVVFFRVRCYPKHFPVTSVSCLYRIKYGF